MINRQYSIKIDIANTKTMNSYATFFKGDTGVNILNISFFQNKVALDLSQFSAIHLKLKRPDDQIFGLNTLDIIDAENGIARYVLHTTDVFVPGIVDVQIEFYDVNGDHISTCMFYFMVSDIIEVGDEVVEGTNQYSLLSNLIAQVSQLHASVWFSGMGTPDNLMGNPTDLYVNHETCDVYQKNNDNIWEFKLNIKGMDGNGIRANGGVPEAEYGKEGDSYIDLNNYNLYAKWNIEGTVQWVLVGNIKGEDGEDGQNGQDGAKFVSNNGLPPTPPFNWGYKQGDSYLDLVTYNLYWVVMPPPGQGDELVWLMVGNIKGASGIPGTDGKNFYTQNGTPDTLLGVEGDSYLNLDTFDMYIKVYQGENLEWLMVGNIKGADASTWLNGFTDPASNLGNVNDMYINTNSYDVFIKRTVDLSVEWVKTGNLKGTTLHSELTDVPSDRQNHLTDAELAKLQSTETIIENRVSNPSNPAVGRIWILVNP